MDCVERQILREFHTFLVDTLDPLFLRGYLYQEGVLNTEQMEVIDQEPVRCRRTESFLVKIVDLCPFDTFMNALKHENMYTFVHDILQQKLLELDSNQTKVKQLMVDAEIARPVTVVSFTERPAILSFYHHLQHYLYEFKAASTIENAEYMMKTWEKKKGLQILSEESALLADKGLIAKVVYFRYLIENGMVCDLQTYEQVLPGMLELIPFTSNPFMSNLFLLSFQAQNLVFSDEERACKIINDLLDISLKLPVCRLSNIILTTYIKVQSYIACKGRVEMCNNVRSVLESMIRVYSNTTCTDKDEEAYFGQTVRRARVVFGLLNLGITFNNVHFDNFHNKEENVVSASRMIDNLEDNSEWEHIELYWKTLYFVCKTNIFEFFGHFKRAASFAEYATELWKKSPMNEVVLSTMQKGI